MGAHPVAGIRTTDLLRESQFGVVVKSGRLVIWGTGFVSALLHMQLLGDLGLVTLL